MWQQAMAGRRTRPVAFLFSILLFLLVSTQLALFFRSTGDVRLYQAYAQRALATPMELPREYPALSIVLFVLPQLLAPQYYMLGFSLLAAFALWLTVLVVDRLSGQGWWLMLYLALGAFGTLFFRYDIVVVPLTVLAFAATTRQRWLLAQALLALGVALKLYPLILMPLVVVDEWRTTRRFPLQSILGGAVGLLLAIGSMLLLAPAQTMGMVRYHRDRPLEFEAVGASLAWLTGPTTAEFSFGSWNLISPLAPVLIALLTAANVVLLLAVYGGYGWGHLSRVGAWLLALLVALATSKVFSTQYLQWVLPFVALATGAPEGARRSGEAAV